jgi:hypothetical protein
LAGVVSGSTVVGAGAFNTGEIGRTSSITTAGDPNAIIGIDGNDDPATVTTFTNTTNSSMSVTLDSAESVEFDVNDNGTFALVPVTFSIAAGGSVDVAIRDGGGAGSAADIDITASNGNFTGNLTRNFDIPQSAAVSQIQASVQSAGNSGQYDFELENTGSTSVTLTEIGVPTTSNGNVTQVGGGGGDILLNTNTGNSLVNNVITIGGGREPLAPNLTLGANNTVPLRFDRFRAPPNGNGPLQNGKMKGDDVRIDVAFSDGSSATLDLCPNTCSI